MKKKTTEPEAEPTTPLDDRVCELERLIKKFDQRLSLVESKVITHPESDPAA